MADRLKFPVWERTDTKTWKNQIREVIELSKELNLQRVELRLPFGIGKTKLDIENREDWLRVPQFKVGVANFLQTPPTLVYSYLLFVYTDTPGNGVSQYLEMKLPKSTGAAVIKQPNIMYKRAGAKGRITYLRIPVASIKKIDKLVGAIMEEANKMYLTVCETL
jgi:hypothetical protein